MENALACDGESAGEPKDRRRLRLYARSPSLIRIMLNRRPKQIPNAVWKFTTRLRASMAIITYMTFAIWAVSLLSKLASLDGKKGVFDTPYLGVVPPLMLLFSVATTSIWWRSLTRRHTRILRKNDCLMCIECGYLLSGLPDDHACPECGTAYVFEETRRRWKDWLGQVESGRSSRV